MRTTDELIGSFVEHLKSTGRWEHSVVMVLADHSMDWSYSHRVISLGAPIWFDPVLHGKVVLDQRGVLSVHTPQELRLGDRVGDLVAYCEEGWCFSDPTIVNNPIPRNHGHPVTEPIPCIIAGGAGPSVRVCAARSPTPSTSRPRWAGCSACRRCREGMTGSTDSDVVRRGAPSVGGWGAIVRVPTTPRSATRVTPGQ